MAQGSYKDELKKDAMSFLNNFDTMGDSITVPSAHHDHSAHAGGEHSHAAGEHDHGGMKMYFHWGVTETILFESWTTQSEWGMALAVVLVFVMGFLYEGLRWLRIYLQKRKPGNSKAKKATSSVQMLQMPESSGAASRADNQTLLDSSPSRAETGRGDAIAAGHEAVEVEPKHNGAAKSCHSTNRNQLVLILFFFVY
ncbi:hypothetical protein WR25_09506 isoform B [Diploscapter pachys]|uniref:Copper transport protein n=1 Tax=Diploscapter pachys TaxID=2018661 RepID=A0A2A2J2X3_9BILA|nr:hypothetical protein WR25_09506 isoform B [Diploscapter pachys]